MHRRRFATRLNIIEALEPRLVLSMTFDGVAAEARGDAGGNAPAIRLDLVALHEFGHALGLSHTSNGSIMDPYYNANYNLNNFANDPVIQSLNDLYANVNDNRGWEDSLDPHPNNGIVDLTYSFMPDGSKTDKGSNTLFATFNKLFSSPTVWKPIFAAQLNLWASVAPLSFTEKISDGGQAFGSIGAAQNDSRFGDIRIGTHQFDGAGKVLAHTYYPPPNGGTAAGDAHFDHSENWVLTSGATSAITSNRGGGATGALVFAASSANDSAVPLFAGAIVMSNGRSAFTVTIPQVTAVSDSSSSHDFAATLTDELSDDQGITLESRPTTVATRRLDPEAIDLAFASLGVLEELNEQAVA